MDRSQLYGLIISQLKDDGYMSAARAVASATMQDPDHEHDPHALSRMLQSPQRNPKRSSSARPSASATRVDLETRFITTHKGLCRTACYSADGAFVATGSEDTTLKLLDVSKMGSAQQAGDEASRPVTRAFYDHTHAVHCVAFHPSGTTLASGSADHTIKMFDTMAANKRAGSSITDSHSVNSIAYHPSGELLLAGTDHGAPHMYHLKQPNQCYLPHETTHHTGRITGVHFSQDGSLYASCSEDGAIR
eukprot:TRINITY_DN14921_c0_g1_i10.p1 TRINITY_DN14921_c0_g1~~TRINITY_DN14921_c0_g1_i10.p1  ORF type:complete len:248 (-),score=47.50 TRINITY_DN14921_c0_g1_i10:389-1132(-)